MTSIGRQKPDHGQHNRRPDQAAKGLYIPGHARTKSDTTPESWPKHHHHTGPKRRKAPAHPANTEKIINQDLQKRKYRQHHTHRRECLKPRLQTLQIETGLSQCRLNAK